MPFPTGVGQQGVHLVDADMIERFKARYPYPTKDTQVKLLTGKFLRELTSDRHHHRQHPP